MVDKHDQAVEDILSSHAPGTGLISAMIRLGVIRLWDDLQRAAALSSGQGVGARSNNGGVDDGTEVPKAIFMLGHGRPGGDDSNE